MKTKSKLKQGIVGVTEKGITLVALIITIIILIILAAVTIKSFYDSKFINTAMNGTINYAKAQGDEVEMMQNISDKLDETVNKIGNINIGGGNNETAIEINVEKTFHNEYGEYVILDVTVDLKEHKEYTYEIIAPERITKLGSTQYVAVERGEYTFQAKINETGEIITKKIMVNEIAAEQIALTNYSLSYREPTDEEIAANGYTSGYGRIIVIKDLNTNRDYETTFYVYSNSYRDTRQMLKFFINNTSIGHTSKGWYTRMHFRTTR